MTTGRTPEMAPRAVILVEGDSDRLAVQVIARRRALDLAGDGVAVIAMQGVTNLGHHLRRYGPSGLGLGVAGLCDEREAGYVGRVLQRARICRMDGPDGTVAEAIRGAPDSGPSRSHMRGHGFFVCTRDLEDELIRAVGVDAVEAVISGEGELRSLRTLQRQVAQRGRSAEDQLRRFFGGRSGNKHRYARLLAEAVDLDRVPAPLDGLLDHVTATLRRTT